MRRKILRNKKVIKLGSYLCIDLFHAYEYKNAFFALLKFVPSTVIKGVEKEKVSGTFDEANI